MRLATLHTARGEEAAVIQGGRALPVSRLNEISGGDYKTSLFELIGAGEVERLAEACREPDLFERAALPLGEVTFAPPYRRPGKIWGIGLNYRDHARDLDEEVPAQPASFMKPATAIIGPGEAIRLPAASQRVTAEAELGLIIGRRTRQIDREEAPAAIFGYTTIIDMTAEDILRQNPRYLTRAKSFDTFFSFGPVVVTADELPDPATLVVKTVVNGVVRAENTVAHMTFDPFELVAFHSHVMTLEPGDIISTGTPGAWVIRPGDVVRCEITGFPVLENPVAAG